MILFFDIPFILYFPAKKNLCDKYLIYNHKLISSDLNLMEQV
jgi:hypothetical protein